MKDLRPALRAALLADATVNGLVGGNRIYPSLLPQGQRAASVVYHRVAEITDYQMNGATALSQALMQIDSWATSADASTQLSNAVHDVLSGLRGLVVASPDSIDFKGIFLSTGRDLFDDVAQMHRLSRDYAVWYWDR